MKNIDRRSFLKTTAVGVDLPYVCTRIFAAEPRQAGSGVDEAQLLSEIIWGHHTNLK